MSGARLTTGIGIAIGGIGGALAALMGAPKAPPAAQAPSPPAPARAAAPRSSSAAVTATAPLDAVATPLASAAATAAISALAIASANAPAASAAEASATAAPAAAAPTPAAPAAPAPPASPAAPLVAAPPPLELPTTRDGLLKAEMLCDQKKDFDECARAALSLDAGSTGPADPEQAKRFRKIALTHLVMQCENGAPHPCFVLAAKYRAGAELPLSPNKAQTLEQRGLELCKKRTGPECPPP